MKKLVLAALVLPFALSSQTGVNKKIKVLFLGNSYIYTNDLPLLVKNIALANGDTLIYDQNCIGGYALANHASDATSISKINSADWDFVVLQAQSQEPSFSPAQVNAQTMPYAVRLDSIIKAKNPCINTVFFETWGYKNGDAGNCVNYPPVCTYTGMQNRLKQSYKKFADTTSGIMAPVGEAYRRSVSTFTGLELYQPDQSHPSLTGSFLAASVFYKVLFKKSVINNAYNPGIATNSLSFLQFAANKVVDDSLYIWNLGKNTPWSDFTYTAQSQFGFQFQASAPQLTHKWYFGDGNTNNTAQPLHNYLAPGSYTVSHVVNNNCKKDSIVKVITIVDVGMAQKGRENDLRLFPNPCTDLLFVKHPGIETSHLKRVQVINLVGEIVIDEAFLGLINTAALSKGIYLLKLLGDENTFNHHFIKL